MGTEVKVAIPDFLAGLTVDLALEGEHTEARKLLEQLAHLILTQSFQGHHDDDLALTRRLVRPA